MRPQPGQSLMALHEYIPVLFPERHFVHRRDALADRSVFREDVVTSDENRTSLHVKITLARRYPFSGNDSIRERNDNVTSTASEFFSIRCTRCADSQVSVCESASSKDV